MPIIFPGMRRPTLGKPQNGVKAKSMPVPPVVKPGAPVSTSNQGRLNNPRAAVVVPETIAAASGKHVTDVTRSLASTLTVSSSMETLPTLGDIINMELDLQVLFDSGATVTGSVQATTAIDHVAIYNNHGSIIMTIRGSQFHMMYSDYSVHRTDFPDPLTAVVASANAQSASANIMMPYMSLPASAGPYSVVVYFVGFENLGNWATNNGPVLTAATGLTSATVICGINVIFGDAGGMESALTSVAIPMGVGNNTLVGKIPFANESIAELILYGFAADKDLQYLSIDTNGATVNGNLSESRIAAADAEIIQATRPTGLFWLGPAVGTQFALNSSSTFDVYLTNTATTTSITAVAYRLSPPS